MPRCHKLHIEVRGIVNIVYVKLKPNYLTFRKEEQIKAVEQELDQEKRMADNLVNDMVSTCWPSDQCLHSSQQILMLLKI